MKITLADKFIAYLALFSGLAISTVAIWYSVAGLVSIFAAAVTPIIVMGVALEISKLIATVWLKLNWSRAPFFIRSYLLGAIAILMVITSMGIFGFLSKAHSDQSLVSGDVQSKIAIYDEKIKTARENIEADRKQLKQMDEAVDQVMGRSTDEKGADKANAIRKSQQRDRGALAKDIEANQKLIATLNDEAAPIRAEVRKVEAEVGPIKYIAAFIYGSNPDANILEKAVTWVIIIIVSVFDPLAVILLLASQYSFQWFRKAEEEESSWIDDQANDLNNSLFVAQPAYEPDDGPLTEQQVEQVKESVKDELPTGATITKDSLFDDPIPCNKCGTTLVNAPGIGPFCPNKECDVLDSPFEDNQLELDFTQPLPVESVSEQIKNDFEAGNIENIPWETVEKLEEEKSEDPLDQWNKMIEAAEQQVAKERTPEEILDEDLAEPTVKNTEWPSNPAKGDRCVMFVDDADRNFIFNGSVWIDADKSDLEAVNMLDESKKKSTYIIKDQDQQIKKTKE
jgi:hypothetical protein